MSKVKSDLKPFKSISIIGYGKVGKALYQALSEVGIEVVSVFSSKEFKTKNFVQGLPNSDSTIGELLILSVPDDALEVVVDNLVNTISNWKGKNVIHCSGMKSSEVLQPLAQLGAQTASFHPMKSVTNSTDDFKKVWFDIEGDKTLSNKLEELCKLMQSNSLMVSIKQKSVLHISAVMASNYLVSLMRFAQEIAKKEDIAEDNSLPLLLPLMESVIQNMNENGVENSLTGPIARGDISTIQSHLDILRSSNNEQLDIYIMLGKKALEIAKLPSNQKEQILDIFNKL